MSPSRLLIAATLVLLSPASQALAQSTTTVGFDGGATGDFTGNFFFEATGGNPDGNAHIALSTFFPSLRTGGMGQPANQAFLGDYSAFTEVTFQMDVKVDSLVAPFTGNPIQRPLGIALVDHDIQGPSGPSGVFFELAVLSSTGQPNWTELAVTVSDTTSIALPAGWIGFGDEDPNSFAPILPSGASFASVLAGVDELRITGAVPGFFFNSGLFDMRIDNVTVVKTASIGTSFCTANPNSTGASGEISATGSDSAAANDVTLIASHLPVGSFGFFIIGDLPDTVNVAGSGVLCLGGNIGRYSQPHQIFQADGAGQFSLAIDVAQLPAATGPVAAAPGDSFYFQAWHRDLTGSGSLISNFTDGLQVDFQ